MNPIWSLGLAYVQLVRWSPDQPSSAVGPCHTLQWTHAFLSFPSACHVLTEAFFVTLKILLVLAPAELWLS